MPPVYMPQLSGSPNSDRFKHYCFFLGKLLALSIETAAEAFDNYAFYILWDITCVDASVLCYFIVKSDFRFKHFSPLQEPIDVIHQSGFSIRKVRILMPVKPES